MVDGHQRLNAMAFQLADHVVIKLQTCLVRLCLIAIWKDPAPRDGKAEALEAHLREQGNVLFVMVVKINRLMAGIVGVRMNVVVNLPLHTMSGPHLHIIDGQAPSPFLEAALILICRGSAAPQKILS